jgi:hypothetical protein
MPVSQNRDKAMPPHHGAGAASIGGVPDAYARLHSSFTWAVP